MDATFAYLNAAGSDRMRSTNRNTAFWKLVRLFATALRH